MSGAFDPVDFVAGTVRPMATYTLPFVCSIVGIENEHEGRHVGSAFRVSAGRKRLLVTAKHVFDEARSAPLGAAFVQRRGDAPARFVRGPDVADDAGDLAVFVLEEADEVSPNFFQASLFDTDHAARAHDYLLRLPRRARAISLRRVAPPFTPVRRHGAR